MMEISNPVCVVAGTVWTWDILIDPVPASRPRIPRFGSPYYEGRYKTFRDEFAAIVAESELPPPLAGMVAVEITVLCKRPKNPANPYPIGDVDNYAKAVLDSLQGNGFILDDKQVVRLTVMKGYVQSKDEEPHIVLRLETLEQTWRPNYVKA